MCCAFPRYLHSFPTRRSSDLGILIEGLELRGRVDVAAIAANVRRAIHGFHRDRKSTRLNSSHLGISYAVFCLKKKKSAHIPTCSDVVVRVEGGGYTKSAISDQ